MERAFFCGYVTTPHMISPTAENIVDQVLHNIKMCTAAKGSVEQLKWALFYPQGNIKTALRKIVMGIYDAHAKNELLEIPEETINEWLSFLTSKQNVACLNKYLPGYSSTLASELLVADEGL